jgi:thymidylate synthase ThyX
MPATIDAEFQKHGLLSSNSESSRARPSGSVSLQVTSDPYIPNWTLNQKGMSGKYADSATSREAYNLTTRHIRECLTYSRNLTDLGIHKQDINKIALNPFVHNHLIVTATEWDNFLNLRCSPEAHPVMQSIANKIKAL